MRELVHAWVRVAVRWTFISVTLSAGLLASAHASAQAYAMRDVEGWTVAASKDKRGCFLTRTYEGAGGTTLLLGLDIDGSNRLSVLNDNWSIKQMDRLKLNFRLSSGGYSRQQVVGIESDGKKGFVTNFETKFPDYFAASKALHISRGDVPVEQLSLEGSGAAVAELRRCVGMYAAKAVAGAREKGRSDQIPRDPFAPDAKRKSREKR
ncbi:MAG: hypothetical protein P0Y59_09235 [Candidatus Sphingomonas phytovorans]|nr:hypothetical protein [Sphingomonas sp.]WEK01838.1 MAG: hypothetical protein P0Y59_09235 [Sphingomonas sp.]